MRYLEDPHTDTDTDNEVFELFHLVHSIIFEFNL